MLETVLVTLILGLGAACALLLLVFLKLRTLVRTVRDSARRQQAVDNEAANRWAEEQGRAFLSSLLKMEPSKLPPLGGWAASPDFLSLVAQHILLKKPATVVEFGSGVSTLVILRCLELNGSGALLSFDHEPIYAQVTQQRTQLLGMSSDIRVVSLGPIEGCAGEWYETTELPDEIDCIIVDGPPGTIHPETREGAATVFSRLRPGGLVFLDDAARPGERAIVKRWAQAHPYMSFSYVATARGTAVGERRHAASS